LRKGHCASPKQCDNFECLQNYDFFRFGIRFLYDRRIIQLQRKNSLVLNRFECVSVTLSVSVNVSRFLPLTGSVLKYCHAYIASTAYEWRRGEKRAAIRRRAERVCASHSRNGFVRFTTIVLHNARSHILERSMYFLRMCKTILSFRLWSERKTSSKDVRKNDTVASRTRNAQTVDL